MRRETLFSLLCFVLSVFSFFCALSSLIGLFPFVKSHASRIGFEIQCRFDEHRTRSNEKQNKGLKPSFDETINNGR